MRCVRWSFPHRIRARLSCALSRRDAARRARRCAARKTPMSTICSPRRRLGAPLLRARFPRAYLDLNREPYELDPQAVRRRFAVFRQHALAARRGGARDDPARRRRRARDLCRPAARSRRASAHRQPLQALSCGLARPDGARRGAFRRGRADRLPFDAFDRRARPALLATRGDKRRIDFVIGDRYGASASTGSSRSSRIGCAAAAITSAQPALCGRLHHRALRQARRRLARAADRSVAWSLHGRSLRSRRTSASTPSPAISRRSWRWWRARRLTEILGGERRAAAE